MNWFKPIKKVNNMIILACLLIFFKLPFVYGFDQSKDNLLSPKINIGTNGLKSNIDFIIGLNAENEGLAQILVKLSDIQIRTVQEVNQAINAKGETFFRARSRKTGEWNDFAIRPLTDVAEAKKLDDALTQEGVKHFSWVNNVRMLKESAKLGKKGFIYAVYQLDSQGRDLKIVAAANSFIEKPGYKTEEYLHTYNVEVLLSARNEFSGIGTKIFLRRMADTLLLENIETTQGRVFFTAASDTAVDKSPYTFYTKLGLNPAIGRDQAEQDGRYKIRGTDFDLKMEDVIVFFNKQFLGFAPDLKALRSQEPASPNIKKMDVPSNSDNEKNKGLETFSRIVNSRAYNSLQKVFTYDETVFPYKAVYSGPEQNIKKVEDFLNKAVNTFNQIIDRFGDSLERSDRDMIQMYLNEMADFIAAIDEYKQALLSFAAEGQKAGSNTEQTVISSKNEGIEIPDYLRDMLDPKPLAVDQAGNPVTKDRSLSDIGAVELINNSI